MQPQRFLKQLLGNKLIEGAYSCSLKKKTKKKKKSHSLSFQKEKKLLNSVHARQMQKNRWFIKSIKILLCNCLTKFARVRNYACGDIKAKINGANSGKDWYKKKSISLEMKNEEKSLATDPAVVSATINK